VERRHRAVGAAAVSLALTLAGAFPLAVATQIPPDERTAEAVALDRAVRHCLANELDYHLSALVIQGRDEQIVALGTAFADHCEVPPQTAGLVDRARQRLASSRRASVRPGILRQ
jgi:hypothetical protein